MSVGKVTQKGRITIPKDVRDELRLQPGDSVVVAIDDGHAIIYPARRRKPQAGPAVRRKRQ